MYNVYNSNGELEKSGFPSYEGAATFCISRGRFGDWKIKSSYGKRDFYRR